LLRALGLGKAVLVSEVGSFQELPDEICLKTPAGAGEEDVVFEYLNLLVSRPSLARAMGARARLWVQKECNWDSVAERYARFLQAVLAGSMWPPSGESVAPLEPAPPDRTPDTGCIRGWTAPDADARGYVETHLTRLEKTLAIIPPGGPEDRILEMGVYFQITPSLRTRLGYGEVRGCFYGPLGKIERKRVSSEGGEVFECDIDFFDAERDRFPYPDGHFSTVLCCEILEHLAEDPMHMMSEINRILKPGGCLVMTTPNLASRRALYALLLGYHPGLFSVYFRPPAGEHKETRHHREYTPIEIRWLMTESGFEVTLLETGPFRETPTPELAWVTHLLERYQFSTDLRGEGIYAVGRKSGPVLNRYPGWLYSGAEE
jgi:SAM-dependent methyltransferase